MRSAPRWLATDVGLAGIGGTASRGGGPRDATRAIGRVLGLCVVAVRGGAGLLGGIIAVVGLAPPATPAWVLPVVAVNLVWTAVFVATTARHGLLTWVMSVDVWFAVVLCLGQVHYVSWQALPAGASWVTNIASMCVISSHLAWRPAVAVPTGVLVAASFVVGQIIAGSPNGGVPEAAVLILQNLSTMGLMMLVRKVSSTADAELFEYYRAEREARIRQAQRSEERETNRRLHDTVLATLTTVGSGAIRQSSATLRGQARSDLAVITSLANSLGTLGGLVRLDRLLGQIAHRTAVPLRVELDLVPCEVPDPVAESFARAAAEALVNVGRHAGTCEARMCLSTDAHTVTVSISDHGRGFDPHRVPTHRFGIREAIVGRMAEHGGSASITSAPGTGTRVTLSWSADD
jgi:signal transduction histidine kinase